MAGKPKDGKLRVFISYSRQDMAFVDRLQEALVERGVEASVDRNDIEKSEAWWARITQLITEADTIVFVLSPGSVDSKVCADEVAFAERLNKRFVPIVARELDGRVVPAALSGLNYVWFIANPAAEARGDFDGALADLVRALETDIPWIREHTRLGAVAERWEARKRPTDLLLRGSELSAAETWLMTRPEKAPDPTDAHRALVTLSRRGSTRRRQILSASLVAGLAVALGLAALAWLQRGAAVEQTRIAKTSLIQAQISESHFRTGQAALASNDSVTTILLALEGLPDIPNGVDRPFVNEAWHALYGATLEQRERSVLVHSGPVRAAVFSPDSTRIATSSFDGTARLWGELGQPIATLRGHKSRVHDVAFSPDSSRLVTTSDNPEVRLWDRDGKLLSTLQAHTDGVWNAAYSSDGSRFATASSDGTARLWDIDGKLLATLAGHTKGLRHVAFSRERIVTASWDNTARLWDRNGKPLATLPHFSAARRAAFSRDGQLFVTVAHHYALLRNRDGKLLATLTGHTGDVWNAAFSPDGARIVTSSSDRTARLWDREGKPLATLQGHTDRVGRSTFSPDGRFIVTASDDRTARIWSFDGKPLLTLRGHLGPVWSAVFSNDGQRVVTTSDDHTARLWEVTPVTVPPGWQMVTTLHEHSDGVRDAAFDMLGERLFTTSADGTKLWKRNGTLLGKLNGDEARYSPNGSVILTTENDSALLWNRDGKPLATLQGHCPKGIDYGQYGCEIRSKFSADGSRIITSSYPVDTRSTRAHIMPRLWDHDGRLLAQLQAHCPVGTGQGPSNCDINLIEMNQSGSRIVTSARFDLQPRLWNSDGRFLTTLEGHTDEVEDVSFSRDGMWIVTASADRTARIWDHSGNPVVSLVGHANKVVSAQFNPDRSRVITVSRDQTVKIWALDGKLLATLNNGTVASAVLSPDGARIITETADGSTHLWDLAGKLLKSSKGAKFSPDGSRIVARTGDTPGLWDSEGRFLGSLPGICIGTDIPAGTDFGRRSCRLTSLSFGAAPLRIVMTWSDHIVRLWDRDGKPLATLLGHSGEVNKATFSPDGTLIVTASEDHTARVWPTYPAPEELIRLAQLRVSRCLTQSQRAQYFLSLTPPTWCVERRLWPYHGDDWQLWLPKQKAWLGSGRQGDAPTQPKAD